MKNDPGLLASVLLLALSLSGCAYLRTGGPCYGFGCGASAPAPSAQSGTVPAPKDAGTKAAIAGNRSGSPAGPRAGD